jgi:hypothetical protein
MNFDDFKLIKKELLEKNSDLIDLSNNNLYDYFKDYKKDFELDNNLQDFINKDDLFYRCHTVEKYLRKMNLPDDLKKYCGASAGVRDSLENVLFKYYDNLIIPGDVYPFYEKSNHSFKYYTLNNNELFVEIPDGVLLVCFPLKPSGRDFTEKEWDNLTNFLIRNESNRIIFDTVYLTNFKIPNEILKLYETNKVIILHSLSKAFLLPNHFGITLLPKSNEGNFIYDLFKKLEKKQERINLSNFYLDMDFSKISKKIEDHMFFSNGLLKYKFKWSLNNSYLNIIDVEWNNLLKNKILGIPESVFGGIGNKTIVSSLISSDSFLKLMLK